MSKRWFLASALLVGCGAAITWAFAMIHFTGKAWLKEDVLWIRYTELGIGVFVFLFGVACIVSLVRRKNVSKHPIKKPKPKK